MDQQHSDGRTELKEDLPEFAPTVGQQVAEGPA